MRIPVTLYGLYLIFLHGGRLNQQRLSSGQSASRQRVLQPLPLSLILHSAVFLCVFFAIFSQTHECGKVQYMCAMLTITIFYSLSEIKSFFSGREQISTITSQKSAWKQYFKIREHSGPLLVLSCFFGDLVVTVHTLLII